MRARAVVVMGRLPRPGQVKTRLAKRVGDEAAARLYQAFLLDVFDVVDAAVGGGAARIFSCALAPDEGIAAAEALAPAGWSAVAQGPGDLGERVAEAHQQGAALAVVVIGSDAPTMPPARIGAAFARLEAGADAVFGPTSDGGYDLIGLCGAQPALLTGIPWSTAGVMAATRQAAARAHLAIEELEVGYDIDHFEDLARALTDASQPASPARRTAAAIAALVEG